MNLSRGSKHHEWSQKVSSFKKSYSEDRLILAESSPAPQIAPPTTVKAINEEEEDIRGSIDEKGDPNPRKNHGSPAKEKPKYPKVLKAKENLVKPTLKT
jgi:hypothetical protein